MLGPLCVFQVLNRPLSRSLVTQVYICILVRITNLIFCTLTRSALVIGLSLFVLILTLEDGSQPHVCYALYVVEVG